MPTRLLTRREVKSLGNAQRDAEIVRTARIREALNEETKSLNSFKSLKAEEVERVKALAEELEKTLRSRIESLSLEVRSLESRKKEALKPLTDFKKELNAREISLGKQAEGLEEREREVSEERHRNAEWQARLADRRAELDEREMDLDRKDRAGQVQAAFISETHKELNVRIETWRTDVEEKEKYLLSRENELHAEKSVLKAEKDWCVNERGEIAKVKKALDSERASVQDAYDRAKKKGIL